MGAGIVAGQVLGERYRLLSRVHDRGAGASWRADDTRREGATVTLKLLRAVEGGALPGELLAVVRALKAFRHDAVPTVLAHGLEGARPWVVFEDLHGRSVGALLDEARSQRRPVELALLRAVIRDVTAALAAAHAAPVPLFAGVITPGAVIVPPKPLRGMSGLLLDLALWRWLDPPDDAPPRSARSLVAEAPELRDGAASPRADVFALAAWITELLATPAPEGATVARVTDDRHRDDVPKGVWATLARATAASPDARYADVAALAHALEAAWQGPAPASRSRLAQAAAAASAGSSLLDTVAPEGPSLDPTRPRPTAPAVVAQAPQPPPPPPPLSHAPPAATARPPLSPLARMVAASTSAPEENPWSTAVLQGVHEPARDVVDDAETLVTHGNAGPAHQPARAASAAGAYEPRRPAPVEDTTLVAATPSARADVEYDATLTRGAAPSLPMPAPVAPPAYAPGPAHVAAVPATASAAPPSAMSPPGAAPSSPARAPLLLVALASMIALAVAAAALTWGSR